MRKCWKILGLISIALFILSGCGASTSNGELDGLSYEETEEVTNYIKIVTNNNKVILAELYPDIAPETVENFQNLVSKHFYDGLIFHRVVSNFMIQTGDPTGTGYGGSTDKIKGEFKNNGVENDLKHDKGVLSMARSEDMDSASSQFFICVNDNKALSYLDGNYAAFGKVIAGYEVAEDISKVRTDENDKPLTTQSIKTIRFVKIENVD